MPMVKVTTETLSKVHAALPGLEGDVVEGMLLGAAFKLDPGGVHRGLAVMKYGLDAAADAALIASEVVRDGKSEGWSGRTEQMEAVAAKLAPFNIVYVDDMVGGWALKGGAS